MIDGFAPINLEEFYYFTEYHRWIKSNISRAKLIGKHCADMVFKKPTKGEDDLLREIFGL